ncbi:DsbA family protein [bacterium]|nr:DsbA family protein [bacterium]
MKVKMSQVLSLVLVGVFFVACQSESGLKDKITKIIEENPEIVTKSIEKNPVAYVEAFQKAVREAQGEMAKKRESDEKKQMEKLYDEPLEPLIRADETFRGGDKNAPITLVEYSDFQCPYCTKGFKTVVELLKEYKGKIRFVYKHLPLDFHKEAKLAAQYYEAVRLQSAEKAFKFHDALYDQQQQIRKGDAFLKSVAKKVGADMKQVAKDVNSEKVLKRLEQDKNEAGKFGMQGTPGFLLNGIPVRGAYPKDYFVGIIKELEKRGKLKL